MCNKCEIYHSKLFENHQDFILNKNLEELNNEFCEEETHNCLKLNYFCKTHNKLCCGLCITKIKGKNDGQHRDCDVCNIEDIKDEKERSIKENINLLKELSSEFDKNFIDYQKMSEEINEYKEKIKLQIQKIFTNIRSILNNREDELLLKVDKVYDTLIIKENILKDIERLSNKIKLSLEQNNQNDNLCDNNVLSLIKKSSEIENNIKLLKDFNSNMNNIYEAKEIKIKFIPEEKQLDFFIENIKTFGEINIINNNFYKLSSIINDKNDFDLINKWIEEAINKNQIKYELIFKMSENGTKSSDFHEYCDNKGPTLTLVKTTKNKIFGGFTPLNWSLEGGFLNDLSNLTFIFSLNQKKKYKMINKNGYGIACSNNIGPKFGCCDFGLKQDLKNGISYANKSCNFLSNNNLELTGGKGDNENFETEELEVFKVIY